MNEPICPYCGKKQNKEPMKRWSWGKIKVGRYLCQCKKLFNLYQSQNNSWTIPKAKK